MSGKFDPVDSAVVIGKGLDMTDKEFKHLNRAQLIEIIYQLQLQVDELNLKNQSLEAELTDRRLRIEQAGNIAYAALEINDCFRNAQKAADQFLDEIKAMQADTEAQRKKILEEARAEAATILESARSAQADPRFGFETEFERMWANMQITGK